MDRRVWKIHSRVTSHTRSGRATPPRPRTIPHHRMIPYGSCGLAGSRPRLPCASPARTALVPQPPPSPRDLAQTVRPTEEGMATKMHKMHKKVRAWGSDWLVCRNHTGRPHPFPTQAPRIKDQAPSLESRVSKRRGRPAGLYRPHRTPSSISDPSAKDQGSSLKDQASSLELTHTSRRGGSPFRRRAFRPCRPRRR